MRIGYSKIGRSWCLDPAKASTVGGDLDQIRLLKRLAHKHPEHEFFLIGRNTGEDPQALGYPDNVVNPWGPGRWRVNTIGQAKVNKDPQVVYQPARDFWELAQDIQLDDMIMWAGQHGGSSLPIPPVDYSWASEQRTTPQVSFVNYGSYLLDFCNRKQLEPLFLVPDPRNYIKMRDLAVPVTRPVLAQYAFNREYKQDFGLLGESTPGYPDKTVKLTKHHYIYSGIELTALEQPHTSHGVDSLDISEEGWRRRQDVGLISNENRREVTDPRAALVNRWLLSNFAGAEIYGTWSDKGMEEINRRPEPVPTQDMYKTLRRFRSTITFPASGSGWITSKIWECFAAGTVCFIHPKYDVQDNAGLRGYYLKFLRVTSPEDFKKKVLELNTNYELWRTIIVKQNEFFRDKFAAYEGGAKIVSQHLKQESSDAETK